MNNKITKTVCKSFLPTMLAAVLVVTGVFLAGCKSGTGDAAAGSGETVAISGAVADTNGNPVPGVIVQIAAIRENNAFAYIGEATSDGSGKYSVQVSSDELFATVAGADEGKFGIVTKAADEALEDIAIYYAGGIVKKDGKVSPFEIPSADAAFTGQLFPAPADQAEITGCDIVVTGIEPEPLMITGTITDKNGAGLEGIVATASEAPSSPLGIHSSTTSDANGNYTLDLSEIWGSILAPYKPPGTPGGAALPEESDSGASASGPTPAGDGEYFEADDGPPGSSDVETSGASGPSGESAASDTPKAPEEGGLDALPGNSTANVGEGPWSDGGASAQSSPDAGADTGGTTAPAQGSEEAEGSDGGDSTKNDATVTESKSVDIHLYFQLLWRIRLGEEFSFIISFGEGGTPPFGQYYYKAAAASEIDWAEYNALPADAQGTFLEDHNVTKVTLSNDATQVSGINQKYPDAK